MQGKFQVVVVADVGHCVQVRLHNSSFYSLCRRSAVPQEDKPAETAKLLIDFAKRNRFGQPIVPIMTRKMMEQKKAEEQKALEQKLQQTGGGGNASNAASSS